MKYTGTIVKEPIVQEKKVTTAIKLNNAEKPIQVILFPGYRDAETIANVKGFNVGTQAIIYGKEERNPKTKEMQIIVNKAYVADNKGFSKQSPVKENYGSDEVNPETDFIAGGLSTGGKTITMSEPREGRKQYYTDGDWYWYKGDSIKTPTTF